MSNTLVSQYTKIYEAGDTDPSVVFVDAHLSSITISVQPLNLTQDDEVLIESNPTSLITQEKAVPKADVTGTVSLSASPLGTFEYYDLPDGSIDLNVPSFITTDILVSKLKPTFETITGATHIAVTVTGRS